MKINRTILKKTSIIALATVTIISAVLRMTHRQGADTFLFIALIGFIFMISINLFNKSPNRKEVFQKNK